MNKKNNDDVQLAALCAAVLPIWMRQLARSRAQSETAVQEMLTAFAAMRPVLEQFMEGGTAGASDGAGVADFAAHVEQMYRGFQYQDRNSQMVTLVCEDMERLLLAVNAPAGDAVPDLNPEAWLARLESAYAMAEQRHEHGASTAEGGSGGGDSDVSFF